MSPLTESKARTLLNEYGSPLYIYDEQIIRNQTQALKQAFAEWKKKHFFYACKANTNIHLLRIIREEGLGLDCVSPFEAELGMVAGFQPEAMLFTVSSMSDADMDFAQQKNILINIDDLGRLEIFGKKYPGSRVCIRLTPEVVGGHHAKVETGDKETKFGMLFSDIPQILQIAKQYQLKIVGLHEHTGSGLTTQHVLESMGQMMGIAHHFPDLQFLDLGGGFPISYRETEQPFDVSGFAKEVIEKFKAFCKEYERELELWFEPGRYLVAEAGILLCTATTLKNRGAKTIVGVDTGFNHLIRPVLYESYHHITNLSNPNGKTKEYDIVGNVCETGDTFAKNRSIAEIRIGDILTFHDAGAYGFSMASHYNSRPLPVEVLLSNGKVKLIRKREALQDFL